MKCLSRINTIEEFNDILAEGVEYGFILADINDLDLIRNIYSNLQKCLVFINEKFSLEGSN